MASLAAALVLIPHAIGAAGDLDRTFDGDGKVVTDVGGHDWPWDVAVQRDGKIVLVGASLVANRWVFVITRYTASGALDPTFGSGGIIRPDLGSDSSGYAVATQENGKIVVAGRGSRWFVLARYNADGALDASFSGDGRVFTDFGYSAAADGLAIQPDGKIVAVGITDSGSSETFVVARYNPNGSLDASFDGDGSVLTAFTSFTNSAADAVVVQRDGKIVVGGSAGVSGRPSQTALARYNADGSLDAGFDEDGKVTTATGTRTEDLALQADGKILVANGGITRYNPDGSFDSSFGQAGKALPNASVHALLLQPDAKIIAAAESDGDFVIVRLDARGRVDNSFGAGFVETDFGPNAFDRPTAAALQPDRRIVVAGVTSSSGPGSDFAVARYLNPAPPQCVVPNVRGKTLLTARRSIARRRCAVGRVTRKFSKRVRNGRVISENRHPGLRLPAGSRVNLVISKGPPPQ